MLKLKELSKANRSEYVTECNHSKCKHESEWSISSFPGGCLPWAGPRVKGGRSALRARACNVNVCKYKEVDLTKLIYIKMASLPQMTSTLKMASSLPSRAVPNWRSRSPLLPATPQW